MEVKIIYDKTDELGVLRIHKMIKELSEEMQIYLNKDIEIVLQEGEDNLIEKPYVMIDKRMITNIDNLNKNELRKKMMQGGDLYVG